MQLLMTQESKQETLINIKDKICLDLNVTWVLKLTRVQTPNAQIIKLIKEDNSFPLSQVCLVHDFFMDFLINFWLVDRANN